jgi:hypothetical protein
MGRETYKMSETTASRAMRMFWYEPRMWILLSAVEIGGYISTASLFGAGP